jgi:succinate dehydrogenase / fumarate reductase, iron-sulfur subunit
MSTTFKILRFDPPKDKAPHFQEYIHTPKPGDTMLEVLKDIRDQQDPSISFRYSCREAVCGSCALTINGQIGLACRSQFETLKTDTVVIEPLPNLEILKDLIVDFKPFWEAYNYVLPYLHPEGAAPPKGHCVDEKDMEEVYQFITCILCGSCYAACPVATRDERYLGPAALAKLYRFAIDPRDKRPWEAFARVDNPTGVWGCDTVFRCNDVCPKEVRPADGIEGLRRRMVVDRTKHLFGRKK